MVIVILLIIIIGITNNNSGYNTNNSGYIWLYDGIRYIITGWWLVSTPLNMKVSWDDYSQHMITYGKIKFMFQTTNQL